jgi:hypothetical protein
MRDERGEGLVLNWYGPGTYSTRLADGTRCSLAVHTEYPRSGAVQITLHPERKARFPLRLRIPHWSRRTTVSVSGQPPAEARPGAYLDLSRDWEAGSTIAVSLDLTPHVWAGGRECAGRVSVYRGPILLAYDPRFNPGKPVDPPALDLSDLALAPASSPGWQPPIVLVQTRSTAGPIVLCDFASAGFDGSTYRSWLLAKGAGPISFSREHPWRSLPIRGDR